MRPSSQLALFVVVCLVGVSLWFAFRRNPQQQSLESRSLATRGLAQELARRYPGSRALVISNPLAQKPGTRKAIQAVEEAGIAGLKEGFGQAIQLEAVVFPDIRPEARDKPRSVYIPSTTTPLSYLVAEDSFDQLAAQHPNADLLVSLIGLPADLSKVQVWHKPGPPRIALLLPDLTMLGTVANLRAAMESEKLAAFVLSKPDGPTDQTPIRGDREEEFNRRFLLVTPGNLDEMLKKYPAQFGLR